MDEIQLCKQDQHAVAENKYFSGSWRLPDEGQKQWSADQVHSVKATVIPRPDRGSSNTFSEIAWKAKQKAFCAGQ